MTDGKRSRRRRGRRGGGRPQQDGAEQPQDAAADAAQDPAEPPRPARRDSRRSVRGDAPPGPPGPSGVRRAPMPDRGGGGRYPRDDRPRQSGGDGRRRDGEGRRNDGRSRPDARGRPDDRGPRVFEQPIPQDPRSMELGAAFREAQTAVRDARKALDKRKAEFADEPDWLVEQLAAAEAHFAQVADEWAIHLETTGRKVVRNR